MKAVILVVYNHNRLERVTENWKINGIVCLQVESTISYQAPVAKAKAKFYHQHKTHKVKVIGTKTLLCMYVTFTLGKS